MLAREQATQRLASLGDQCGFAFARADSARQQKINNIFFHTEN